MKMVICHLAVDKKVCNETNSTTSSALSLSGMLRSGGLNVPDWTSESKASLPRPLHVCVLQEKIHKEKKPASYFVTVLAKMLIMQN